MADMRKVYDDLTIINLYHEKHGKVFANFCNMICYNYEIMVQFIVSFQEFIKVWDTLYFALQYSL